MVPDCLCIGLPFVIPLGVLVTQDPSNPIRAIPLSCDANHVFRSGSDMKSNSIRSTPTTILPPPLFICSLP